MTGSDLEVEVGGDICVAKLSGEVDYSNARELGRVLLEQVGLEAGGVVLDLSAVRYLDSSGIALIFRVASALATRRQGFAIAVPEESPVRRVFSVTSLPTVVTVAADIAAAKQLLDQPGDVA